jgi:hypothetical protein
MNDKSQGSIFIRSCQSLFLLTTIFLFVIAIKEYKGDSSIYVLFTIMSYALIYSGFRNNALFFDTFIGIFFWLGFWFKLTIRVAFMEGQFAIPVGNFDGSGASFDQALLVASCGFCGLIVASYIREKFLFVYPSKITDESLLGLSTLYVRYRIYLLTGFILLFVTIAITNVYFGIYQRGTVPSTILPYGLSGVYKWLLLFGLASFSALILKFEYIGAKKTSYSVALISLMESFVSNVSLLSRGMIINVSALMYGVFVGIKQYEIKLNIRFLATCFVIFVILFGSSVVIVNYLRAASFAEGYNALGKNSEVNTPKSQPSDLIEQTANSTKVLFLDRWIGIEGVMAVSSYPDKGWDLWENAWQEKYSDNKTSFYDMELIDSPYKYTKMIKVHFVSLSGIVAFCFYPGSFLFLFICIFIVGIFASLIEIITFGLGGKNTILCALLAQVIAFRLCSFGYVPGQSYLLFGTIILNIIMIFGTDRLLVLWFKRKGILNF